MSATGFQRRRREQTINLLIKNDEVAENTINRMPKENIDNEVIKNDEVAENMVDMATKKKTTK